MKQILVAEKMYINDNAGVLTPLWVTEGFPNFPTWNYDPPHFCGAKFKCDLVARHIAG